MRVEEKFDCELAALKFTKEPLVNDEALHVSIKPAVRALQAGDLELDKAW